MTFAKVEKMRQSRQQEIDASKTVEARRQMGQFATPFKLSSAIVRETLRFLPREGRVSVLEPSMGTGSFVSAFHAEAHARIARVCGCELDDEFYRAAVEMWGGRGTEIVHGDFTTLQPNDLYDVVVANPPYVRHHLLGVERKRQLQTLVKKSVGVSISGLAGLYCHFLLLSRLWMKRGGIGAWLIPSEWMSVNYGTALRDFLSNQVRLLRVHHFDSDDVRFEDALVSSCVVWFENSSPGSAAPLFTSGMDLEHPDRSVPVAWNDLRRSRKWPPQCDLSSKDEFFCLGDFFDVKRGIATGDNGFFVLPESEARRHGLSPDFLKPILPCPRNLNVSHILSDEHGFPLNVERRFLLDCSGRRMLDLPSAVRAYLETGLETTARRNLCSSRTVWYEQEQRNPAPLLCSYMGRGGVDSPPVRFILNDSRAIVTNSFLMLYPRGDLARVLARDPESRFDVWHLLTDIPADEIRQAGRSYGGGLQKIEPKELGHVPCSALVAWLEKKLGTKVVAGRGPGRSLLGACPHARSGCRRKEHTAQ